MIDPYELAINDVVEVRVKGALTPVRLKVHTVDKKNQRLTFNWVNNELIHTIVLDGKLYTEDGLQITILRKE